MERKRLWLLDSRICWTVLVAFALVALVPASGRAALVQSRLSTGELVADRAGEVESIRRALERDVVAQRLADYGLTPEEVEAKLPTFSDAQVHQLASVSDGLAQGGVLGTVIAALLVVVLVLVILRLAD